MRLLPVAVAAALLLPAALASHPVEHDPLGFYDPDGPLLAETCAQTLFPDAPPLPEVPLAPVCEGLSFFVEAATDGYVLQVQRTAPATFEVRVRHGLDPGAPTGPLPLGAPLVALAPGDRTCATAAACDNNGLWVHALQGGAGDDGNPLTGRYFPQTIAAAADGLSWTIALAGTPASAEQVTLVAVVGLASGEWARGFYNPAKLALPLDALDAAPYPTSV